MSAGRLTFLYPHLGRLSERVASSGAATTATAVRSSRCKPLPPSLYCQHAATIATTSAGRQAAFPRHGKAVEPTNSAPSPSLDSSQATPVEPKTTEAALEEDDVEEGVGTTDIGANSEAQQATPPKTSETEASGSSIAGPSTGETSSNIGTSDIEAATAATGAAAVVAGAAAAATAAATGSGQGEQTAPPSPPPPPPQDAAAAAASGGKSPIMDSILFMGPPTTSPDDKVPDPSSSSSSSQPPPDSNSPLNSLRGRHPPPHLTTPPYVHHFDSYSLVKHLSAGGFTLNQAITAMKAVRGILASNLDVAQSGLVSKSDVENETYLFRAACSELSTEVRNNRRVSDEALRQQRTLLQHEVDILSQRLNQELLTLNDTVRGMFNDRRMATREEQKTTDSAIQQINYKISVTLNSDAKSEIEGLRWVLIRRSVLGIIFMAVLTLGTLRYASHVEHERQKKADKAAREEEQERKFVGKHDNSSAPEAAEILAAN
ncbi:hypothetical protein B0H63DRAFT_487816 [Podospora didyma]|uniref:MOZ protein represents a chromatin-associated acetyltransferase n=1 Tax=Podospora didyma TaxID=330526 RepID=A0AAE0K2E8_9PEZI|nr:hypothetical protein B0H63DRAFT_487816 [Podospora didyma]